VTGQPDVAACGLPLVAGEEIGRPIAAIVVVKTFDPDSEVGVCYRVHATEGLSTVEALGMADYAVLKLSKALRCGDED
jgi:hypothetical protein